MNRIKILLSAAAIIAVGSSFTALKDSDDQEYIDVNGQRTPIEEVTSDMGECLPDGSFCIYKLAEDGVTKLPVDPGNHWEDATP